MKHATRVSCRFTPSSTKRDLDARRQIGAGVFDTLSTIAAPTVLKRTEKRGILRSMLLDDKLQERVQGEFLVLQYSATAQVAGFKVEI